MLKENYDKVQSNVLSACEKGKRDEKSVTLIAVSKTKPLPMLQEIYDTGCRDFGENKVQELTEKWDQLPKDIKWHMIGHLQSNKVKYIVDKVALIHSVDSVELAEKISKEAMKHQVCVSILIEVNVAKEPTKYGFIPEAVLDAVIKIAKLPGIQIEGLMTIAPNVENGEENRIIFQQLRQLSVDIKQKNIDNVNMNALSMGMTGDYEVAIQEGATYVRVGTGIFGERHYFNT